MKEGVTEIFAKFAGEHLCQSRFFNKVATLLKKETLAQGFSCEFCEIFMNTFFIEHLRGIFISIHCFHESRNNSYFS